MSKTKELAATSTAFLALAAGCAESAPDADETFQQRPATNFAVANCQKDPASWAKHQDSDPENPGSTFTLGVLDQYDDNGNPSFKTGVTIRESKYPYTYEFATPEGTTEADLSREPYVEVLEYEAENGQKHSAVIAAIITEAGKVEVSLDCIEANPR
jgi:hypothetical protein